MELFLTLLALYALQCVIWLPAGAALFLRPGRSHVVFEGPGWRLTHPLPSAQGWIGVRPEPPDPDAPAAGGAAKEASPSIEASCAGGDCRAAHDEVEAATRVLRWLADGEFLVLFVLLPLLILALHEETALLALAPVVGVLHLAAVVALFRAHGKLRPVGGGARGEWVASALLYPPILMRSPRRLRALALERFHPAAVAATVLDRSQALAVLRREIAGLRRRAGAERPPEAGWDARLHRALLGLAQGLGATEAELSAPPPRQDRLARAYCPVCLAEYRIASGHCSDCVAALAPFAPAPESAV